MPFVIDARDNGIPYQQRLDAAGRSDGQPVYVGWADPGEATSAARWRITKAPGSGSAWTAVQDAGGAIRFDKVWDARASLDYS